MFGFKIIRTKTYRKFQNIDRNYSALYAKYQAYKEGYNECLKIMNPEDFKIIEKSLIELGVL